MKYSNYCGTKNKVEGKWEEGREESRKNKPSEGEKRSRNPSWNLLNAVERYVPVCCEKKEEGVRFWNKEKTRRTNKLRIVEENVEGSFVKPQNDKSLLRNVNEGRNEEERKNKQGIRI